MASSRADYIRNYRANNPGYVEESKRRARARQRAHIRLAQRYPQEFKQLIRQELRKEREQSDGLHSVGDQETTNHP